MATINDPFTSRWRANLDFTWSPTGTALTWTADGVTFPYIMQSDNVSRASDTHYAVTTAPINTLLTFTASYTTPPTGIGTRQFRWDFGDGTIAYGATATHTFKVLNPHITVALLLQTTDERVFKRAKQINLR